jgi:hypothetical protein
MARQNAQETKAQELREAFEGQYGELTVQQLEDELVRQVKTKADHEQSKKDYAKSYGELVKNAQDSITYIVERIDYLQHEAAVQNVLEQAG